MMKIQRENVSAYFWNTWEAFIRPSNKQDQNWGIFQFIGADFVFIKPIKERVDLDN